MKHIIEATQRRLEVSSVFVFDNSIRETKVEGAKLQYKKSGNVVELYSLRVPQTKRGQGLAKKAMLEFVKQLDKENLDSKLISSPLDKKTSDLKLKGFYEKFGYKDTGKTANPLGDPIMYRKAKSKVTAGISPIVYHETGVNRLVQILKSNKFALTLGESIDIEDMHGGKPYFFSTMRTKSGKYFGGNARLTLDGRKLGQRYKGKAVDYYGPKWREMDKGQYEQEDRIWHSKPIIPDAKKYIIEIDLNIAQSVRKDMAVLIIAECKRSKIAVNVYKTNGDYRRGKNAIQGIEWIAELMERDQQSRDFEKKFGKSSRGAKYLANWFFYIKGLEEYLKFKPSMSLGDYLRKQYSKAVSRQHNNYDSDLKGSLHADIHNAKRDKDPTAIYYINKLQKLANRKGYKVHELHKYIIELRNKMRLVEQAQDYMQRLQSFEGYYDTLKKAIKEKKQLPENKHVSWIFAHDYVFEDLDKHIESLNTNLKGLNPKATQYANRLQAKVRSDGHTSLEMAIIKMRKEHELSLYEAEGN